MPKNSVIATAYITLSSAFAATGCTDSPAHNLQATLHGRGKMSLYANVANNSDKLLYALATLTSKDGEVEVTNANGCTWVVTGSFEVKAHTEWGTVVQDRCNPDAPMYSTVELSPTAIAVSGNAVVGKQPADCFFLDANKGNIIDVSCDNNGCSSPAPKCSQ